MSQICPCDCHGRWQHPCSFEGGCGHLHRDTQLGNDDEQRRCARGPRCADRTKHTRQDDTWEWVGSSITTAKGLCGTCHVHLVQAAEQLPADYRELDTLLAPTGGAQSDRIRFSKELPIPIRLAVKTLQESIVTELDTWVEPVTAELGIDWLSTTQQATSRAIYRVDKAAAILAKAPGVLLALPAQEVQAWDHDGAPVWDDVLDCHDTNLVDGVDAAMRLVRLHELTKIVAGRTELVHRLDAPCPKCSRLTLVRDNGDDIVHCQVCKDSWPEEDYKRLCLVLCSDERRRIKICDQCDKNGLLPDRTVCRHEDEVAA